MHGSAKIVGEITAFYRADAEKLSEIVRTARPTHIWAYRAVPAIGRALDVRLAGGASYLLRHTAEGWTVVRDWPHAAESGR